MDMGGAIGPCDSPPPILPRQQFIGLLKGQVGQDAATISLHQFADAHAVASSSSVCFVQFC
jgi:hypothetical protein